MTAEATEAREALIEETISELRRIGGDIRMQALPEISSAIHGAAAALALGFPAPAPRKVGKGLDVHGVIRVELERAYRKHGRDPWGRHEFFAILREEVDELWDAIKGDMPDEEVVAEAIEVAAMVFRYIETNDRYRGDLSPAFGRVGQAKLAKLAALDAEGMVEEGLGENVAPNVGDAKAQGVKVDALPCSDAPSPTPSASPWWMVPWPENSYAYVWRTEDEAWRGAGSLAAPIPLVPRSDLARVQRERDHWERRTKHLGGTVLRAWEALREWWQYSKDERDGETLDAALTRALDADRGHDAYALAEAKKWRDESTTLRAERDAALDRARVAEQRIETGVVCWQDREGHLWAQLPGNVTVAFYGPFTRGRFVATEYKA